MACKAQERFELPLGSRTYTAQYAPLYDARLRMLRPRVRVAATRAWSARELIDPDVDPEGAAMEQQELDSMDVDVPALAPKVLGLRPGQTSVIVGVVYATPPNKPDVLSELARELSLPPQPISATYTEGSDAGSLFIEDESGRIQLAGPALGPPPGGRGLQYSLVTGAVVGVLGRENNDGQFVVQDVLMPDGSIGGAPRELPHQLDAHGSRLDGPAWIALVAGLAEGAHKLDDWSEPAHAPLRRQLLAEWLAGELPGSEEAQQVVRLVVAGDAFAPSNDPGVSADFMEKDPSKAAGQARRAALSDLDNFLAQLTCSMPVHVQPGTSDPVPNLLPQQPVHRALLPQSGRWSGLVRETNPAWIGLAGPEGDVDKGANRGVLSVAGETVRDIGKYWPGPWTAPLRSAVLSLRWHHVAPTAPDTLWCIPATGVDPFVVDQWPDVYVVGGQPGFATTLIERTCLLHTDVHHVRVTL